MSKKSQKFRAIQYSLKPIAVYKSSKYSRLKKRNQSF